MKTDCEGEEWNEATSAPHFIFLLKKTEIKLVFTNSHISFIGIFSQVAPIFVIDLRNRWRFLKANFLNKLCPISFLSYYIKKERECEYRNRCKPACSNKQREMGRQLDPVNEVLYSQESHLFSPWPVERLYVKCTQSWGIYRGKRSDVSSHLSLLMAINWVIGYNKII